MIRRIFAWTILISGFPIYLFFRNYKGELIPYPLFFEIIGLILVIVGFILVRKTKSFKALKQKEKAEQIKANLISNGNKIEVKLEDCEIKEDRYFQDQDLSKDYSDFELMNFYEYIYLYENLKPNRGGREIVQSVVIYKTTYNGKDVKFFSLILPFDRVKLLFEFDKHRKTNIYIDSNNSDLYYFDLGFIK